MREDILYASLKDVRSLAIIGMGKNTGKTTFLNTLIDLFREQRVLALTSIGRDGEDIDIVGNHKKPRIFVEEGTLVITARGLLHRCDITIEILETTGISTAVGEVVLIRARSSGYVELAGPSRMEDMKRIAEQVYDYAPEALFIIDGALSRHSPAAHVAEACVLCTGASISPDLEVVVEETARRAALLSLEPVHEEVGGVIREGFASGSLVLFGEHPLVVPSMAALSLERRMFREKVADYPIWGFRGAFTEGVYREWIEGMDLCDRTLVVEDGTRIFLQRETYARLKSRNLKFQVLKGISLKCILYNPSSPEGHQFSAGVFEKALEESTGLLVMDTRGRRAGC